MKPYKNLRNPYELNEHPDNQEVHQAGRKSSASGKERGIIKSKVSKAQARRMMKRQDETSRARQDYRDSKDKE